jgi:8-oxo-dGTP pyrophosphatase MutT (NUDIX family)
VSESETRILRVADLDLAYEPRPWAFADNRAEDIARHWAERKAVLPRMFDGRILLLGRHEFAARADGETILRGAYFETDFKAFLAWRDFGFPDAKVCNCFSMAALQSSDGAYLLGEMGAHTANAGMVYFAAGTPDRNDVFDARVDLFASVRRELQEETGISPEEVSFAADWTVVYAPPRIACMKTTRIAATAQSVKARIEAFLARDAEPELHRMHIVRNPRDIDALRSTRVVADFLRDALRDA